MNLCSGYCARRLRRQLRGTPKCVGVRSRPLAAERDRVVPIHGGGAEPHA